MPQKSKFGFIPPLELLKLWVDNGFWCVGLGYSRQFKAFLITLFDTTMLKLWVDNGYYCLNTVVLCLKSFVSPLCFLLSAQKQGHVL